MNFVVISLFRKFVLTVSARDVKVSLSVTDNDERKEGVSSITTSDVSVTIVA